MCGDKGVHIEEGSSGLKVTCIQPVYSYHNSGDEGAEIRPNQKDSEQLQKFLNVSGSEEYVEVSSVGHGSQLAAKLHLVREFSSSQYHITRGEDDFGSGSGDRGSGTLVGPTVQVVHIVRRNDRVLWDLGGHGNILET